MRQRLSTIGAILLVVVVVLGGVTGCERKAEQREPQATEAEGTSPTSEPVADAEATSKPEETVVSAVTSEAGAEATPTLVPISETSGATAELTEEAEPEATAAPATEPPPSSGGATVWHTVRRGETLSSIARRYGTTWQTVARANSLVNPNQIYVGQKLKIPKAGSPGGGTSGCRAQHTVRSGEWVWQIARNYGVSPYDILAANGLTIQGANTIYPGKVLCIP